MSASRLIVCEKTGRWAAALRAAGATVSSLRSLTPCAAALAADPAAVLAIETTPANVEAVLALLLRVARLPQTRLAALLSADFAAAEPLLREAGACDVLTSVTVAPRLVRLARRQQRQSPPPAQSLREMIAARLPWAAHAPA
jgi:hypothetical protein